MRILFFFLSLLLPAYFHGQQFYSIGESVPSSTQLISVGQHTVLIQPIDLTSKEQKWMCLDSNFSVISAKKLVTQDPIDKLVNQVYTPMGNAIIRLDQFLEGDQIILSAFAFDAQGNLLKNKLLEPLTTAEPLYALPFYITQSPNKQLLSVSQSVKLDNDSLQLRSILLDKDLNIKSNSVFRLPLNHELYDFYMPIVNYDETIFFMAAEKFNSYRMGTELLCYYQQKGSNQLKQLRFDVDRKKLKKIEFKANGNLFYFQALYSTAKEKDEIAGVVNGGFDFSKMQYLNLRETPYSEETNKQLKKAFWADRRRGNFLNYLALLPNVDNIPNASFAYLLPKEESGRIDNSKSYDNPTNDIGKFQQKAAYTASLVGTTQPGYAKPLNQAEAADFAARQAATQNQSVNKNTGPQFKEQKPESTNDAYQRNLILFSSESGKEARSLKLHKIKTNAGQEYQFFTYYTVPNGYAALYYASPSFGLPYMNCLKMNNTGVIKEKKVFENSSKIILAGYPFLIEQNTLTGFCEDKDTGLTGLIKFNLW